MRWRIAPPPSLCLSPHVHLHRCWCIWLVGPLPPGLFFVWQNQEDSLSLYFYIFSFGAVLQFVSVDSICIFCRYAGALFADACLKGLNGVPDVVECTFVQSSITELPFFASKVINSLCELFLCLRGLSLGLYALLGTWLGAWDSLVCRLYLAMQSRKSSLFVFEKTSADIILTRLNEKAGYWNLVYVG